MLWPVAVLALSLLPGVPGILARLAFGDAPFWRDVALASLFFLTVALLGGLTAPRAAPRRWSLLTPFAAAVGLTLLLAPVASERTALNWFGLAALWVALLHVGLSLIEGRGWRALAHLALLFPLAGLAGFIPVAALQWRERFSGEEAFAILQAGLLAVVFLLLLLPAALIAARARVRAGPSFALRRRWIAAALLALAAALAVITLFRYQASFYDPAPPVYSGISEETPFLCLPGQTSDQVYDGKQVFSRLIAGVAANPNKRTPEYGMLALGTREQSWAEQFRAAILAEAAAGRYTGPSNSVKYTQYEASLRAYYLPRIESAFPELFSRAEKQSLRDWFAAINRRALTVEWSDWIYAAALGIRPTGLYENQENGAGLLANLASAGLEAAELESANRDYLAANVRGRATRFRNTDDTVGYQIEWINNASFQALAGQPTDERFESLSYEWLLLQTLPSGQAPPYNHPVRPSLAGIAYAAAAAQRDPRYIWLAGRSLDNVQVPNERFSATPGAETAIDLQGSAPPQGSCLLYGNSGLPTRGGPLAPDKVVLRSGWDSDASYALINLRFTGWHRYKATNTAPVVAFGEPVVGDQPGRETFRWLPSGRSLFRDKRIRREDLNGLLIPARGLAPVARALTGVGSQWAQDPPWHAQVRRFGREGEWDMAETTISDWHGWQHSRATYLRSNGKIIVVVDEATGPTGDMPGLAWHLEGGPWVIDPIGYGARKGEGDAARRVLSRSAAGPNLDWQLTTGNADWSELLQTSSTGGELRVITVFLAGEWARADVSIQKADNANQLFIRAGGENIPLPLAADRDSN